MAQTLDAKHFAHVLWPVAMVLALLVVVGFVFGADWNNLAEGPTVNQACLEDALTANSATNLRACVKIESRLADSLLIAAIVTVKLLVASIMLRRMPAVDWLTISLAAMMLVFAAVWGYILAGRLWPEVVNDHRNTIQWMVRGTVLIIVTWAAVQLLRTPDPAIEERRLARLNQKLSRAQGVREGHSLGMTRGTREGHAAGMEEGAIEGYAEGVAQEQADQHIREGNLP